MASLEHGLKYEKFVKQFLTNKYKNIWLWSEIPIDILHKLHIIESNETNCTDIGCDILAETSENIYHFIQCKNFSTIGFDNTVMISDLAGFYNFMAENKFENGIVYYSGYLSCQIIKRAKFIKYINLPYNLYDDMILTPYSYQIDAYNKLSITGRNILTMPCGTGKTYVSYLLSRNFKNIIVLSPLISTSEQLYTYYKKYYNNIDTHNVSVFNCMNKNKFINETKFNVIISTYDSVNIIYDKINKLQNKIIIIDEYHNLSLNNITNIEDPIHKILHLENTTYLFMSATPNKHILNYPNIFGSNQYILSWNDAITNKYICEYKFYYPNPILINKKVDMYKSASIFTNLEINKTILMNKSYYLLECIKEFNTQKIIVFLKTISEANEFCKILNLLNSFFNFKLTINEINCNTCKSERNKILSRFKNKNDTINILCNVHILDEGIDIPECDAVYLTHPNHNPINFIQRISRCNRIKSKLTDNKNVANIFIWAKDENKLANVDKLINEYLVNKQLANIKNIYIRGNTSHQTNSNVSIISDTIVENIDSINSNELYYKKNQHYIEIVNNLKTNKITIIDNNNNIWFSLSDIYKFLGYSNPNIEINRLDIDSIFIKTYAEIYKDLITKPLTKIKNIQPHAKMTNDDGLYRILIKSNKIICAQFRNSLLLNIN